MAELINSNIDLHMWFGKEIARTEGRDVDNLTKEELKEYRQLAKQIGVPVTIISYATEAVLLRAIGLSVIITILKFIRDFFGAVFNLGSTKNELFNDFWNQWEAAPKDKSGIIWQFRKYLVMFFEGIGEFIKQPGFLLKYGDDALNLIDKVFKSAKENFSEVWREFNPTIRAGEEELRNVVQEAAASGTSTSGTLEDFKETYSDPDATDLGNGRFKRSDNVIFKWNGTTYEYD
jgi:hypothetical protein